MNITWIAIMGALLFASVLTVNAAPLPTGTLLQIDRGVASFPNISCSTGSCIGFEVAPGFIVWADFGPGSDNGLVVGKAQACGGQENGPSTNNSISGEMTSAFKPRLLKAR